MIISPRRPPRAYVKALDGSVAVFLVGVADVGALVFQQHLDAVNRPGSEGGETRPEELTPPGPAARRSWGVPSPAEELLQHHVGDGRGQDSHPDGEQLPPITEGGGGRTDT